jgi:rifampicin phosphotransferase
MHEIVTLTDQTASEPELVGGKGANLGLLVRAGFPVPPGYVITTAAYSAFLTSTGLDRELPKLVAAMDFSNPASVESGSAEIRARLLAEPMPTTLADEISKAHRQLGVEYVAVRSSGTAEDLAGASFAGLHDTYLDIRGSDEVLDAVRRCWASMWTARAASYRQGKAFDHNVVQMAVVVQAMVESEVSGVAFTGNPLNAASDECVIDASWGLGESVVSGLVNPDQFVFKTSPACIEHFAHFSTMQVRPVGKLTSLKEKRLGTKEVRLRRNLNTGSGTLEEPTSEEDRTRYCLDDAEARQVAELGLRVQRHYDDLPQDIEWAISDGTLYLLQSRPITGVDFSWDEDVDGWQTTADREDTIWTRVLADEAWTGAITPLMYSFRSQMWSAVWHVGPLLSDDFDLRRQRFTKYHRGEVYFNSAIEKACTIAAPKISRPAVVGRLCPQDAEEALQASWSPLDYTKMILKYNGVLRGKHFSGKSGSGNSGGIWSSFTVIQDYIDNHLEQFSGIPPEELRELSEVELKLYIERHIHDETNYATDFVMPSWNVYARDIMSALGWLLATWYDGANPNAFLDLVTGTPKPTVAFRENVELRQITQAIQRNPAVLERFTQHPGAEFFAGLDEAEGGNEVRELCDAFLLKNGHRGHADRDVYFPRYADDPTLLHGSLAAHLKTDEDPQAHHESNNRRRDEVIDDVIANLRRKPLGTLRVEAFKVLLDWTLKFLEIRDNERFTIDRSTYTLRLAFLEYGRRLRERGLLDQLDDVWFLTKDELYDLDEAGRTTPLVRAKIEGRRNNFLRFKSKEVAMPKFLQNGQDLQAGQSSVLELSDGRIGYQGMPTSSGNVEGTARLVRELSELGRVAKGEIAVVHATDPGWTPIFAIVRGIVAETGGMLSHCSSLAREHGLPAAQLEQALALIPDGARIRLNGNSGVVEILEESPAQADGPTSDEPELIK